MKKRFNKKAALITSLVLLVALLAVGAGCYYMQTKSDGATKQPAPSSDDLGGSGLALGREINGIAQSQGTEAAQQKLDEKIAQAATKEDQANLYSLKMSVASSSGEANAAQVALQYAYKAEEAYPTFGSALNIADMEYAANNKAVALKYYELYMTRSVTDDGNSLDPTGKVFYERRIQELKS